MATELVGPGSANVMLTDDEIVALSVRSKAVWPTVTPTVSRSDEAELLKSVQRGVQSLVARGFIKRKPSDTLHSEIGKLVNVVLEGRPQFAMYVAIDDVTLDVQYVCSSFHKSGERWVSESTTPFGLHYLGHIERSLCFERAAEMLDQAAAGSFDEALSAYAYGSTPPCFCVMGVPTDGQIRAATAKRSTIVVGSLAADDGGFVVERQVESGSGAVTFVMS